MTREDWFRDLLKRYPRIAVVGPPKAGKSTLVSRCKDRPVIHGDDYMHLGWSEASQAIADAGNAIEGPLVVEGTAVPRALRKGLRVDCVAWLTRPLVKLTPGQSSMEKGITTVMNDWKTALGSDAPPVEIWAE